jgi:biotin transport system substrate-specific component
VWPVFAGEGFGFAYLATAASAGYLLAYPLAALAVGAVSRRWNTFAGAPLAVLAGSAVIFTVGVTWLHVVAGHATWIESIEAGWLRFVIWDLAKVALVGGLYAGVRRLS